MSVVENTDGHVHAQNRDRPRFARQLFGRVAGGLLIVLCAAALCGVLALRCRQTRTVDLSSTAAGHLDALVALLERNRVPADHIHEVNRQTLRDQEAAWDCWNIALDIPPMVSASGLRKLVAQHMAQRGLGVSRATGEDNQKLLAFLAGRLIATVQFKSQTDSQPTAAPILSTSTAQEARDRSRVWTIPLSAPPRADLLAHSRIASETVTTVLMEEGFPLVKVYQPVDQQTDRDEGQLFRMGVRIASSNDRGRIAQAIGNAFADDPIEIDRRPSPNGDDQEILVILEGRPLVALTLYQVEARSLGLPHYNGPDYALIQHPEAISNADADVVSGEPLAIIVDDGGYGGPTTEAILALPPVLTLSILPNTPYAAETAQRARQLGFEVMLHMPMESGNPHVHFPGEVTVDMTSEEIESLTLDAIEQVPGCVAANNHTGSRFTANLEAMTVFMGVLRRKGLFFVDSRTASDSTAGILGMVWDMPVLERSVFLDNKDDPRDIHAQFRSLIEKARNGKQPIGICHFRPATAQVLAEILPALPDYGVRAVHISELVH
jgi:polysaccharide deacetylase 2 family uncharacterized protein YibQ